MGTSKRRDPTYAALASGPGSFKRAMEAALKREPLTEPPVAAPPSLPLRTQPDPRLGRNGAGTPAAEDSELETAALPPPGATPAYCRVLEELSTYVVPLVAHRMLRTCLEAEESCPETAISYDLRAILVEALPEQLRKVLPRDRATAAVEAVEHALMYMHAPNTVPRRRRSRGSLPVAGSTPPIG